MNIFIRWAMSGLLCMGSAQLSNACAFHGYIPEPTLVDALLTTEQIIIARLDPAQPSRYQLEAVLMGPDMSDVPVPVAPNLRKILSGNPSASILLARDGAYGPWLALTVLDSRLKDVMRQVVQHHAAFNNGDGTKRVALFAQLLNDPSPAVRLLALQELDRAPYQTLRKANLPQIRNLKQELETGDEALMPIRILLAGLSHNKGLSSFLSSELEMAVEGNIDYLGAYATALIELEGKSAVKAILEHHLSNQSLPLGIRTKLLEALSIQHKTAPRQTRRAIARGVASLLKSSPELRAPAKQFFGFRSP